MVLVQYLRRKRGGRPVKAGVMLAKEVALKDKDGKVLVGWSKCKLSTDKFDAKLGVEIAESRINSRLNRSKKKVKVDPTEKTNGTGNPPHSMRDDLKNFVKRCKRYFKTKNVKVV